MGNNFENDCIFFSSKLPLFDSDGQTSLIGLVSISGRATCLRVMAWRWNSR